MTDSIQKLEQDVTILSEMAAQMDDYLKSDILFWKMGQGGMPMLTLGGYLMRQYRLLTLADLLPAARQEEMETAVIQGKSTNEVAEIMDMKPNAVYKLLHDARTRLKKELEKEGLSTSDILSVFE